MENPNIKVEVVHSKSKDAWNIIGISLGNKHKIARIPYLVTETIAELNNREQNEALLHAEFISICFNNSQAICQLLTDKNKT